MSESQSRDNVFQTRMDRQEMLKTPMNDLELSQMMVDPRWGDDYINKDLKAKLQSTRKIHLKAGSAFENEKGEIEVVKEDRLIDTEEFLWGQLSFYTRDFRMGNLDKQDYDECKHFTLLAADLLTMNMRRAFIVCLARVSTRLELSQSRGGFLRTWTSTFRKVEERRDVTENPNLIFPKKGKGGM